jgi:hypothetical protein
MAAFLLSSKADLMSLQNHRTLTVETTCFASLQLLSGRWPTRKLFPGRTLTGCAEVKYSSQN